MAGAMPQITPMRRGGLRAMIVLYTAFMTMMAFDSSAH
jgi:hypothetical protein